MNRLINQSLRLGGAIGIFGLVAAYVARTRFVGKLDALEQRLADAQVIGGPRTDLPPEIVALAKRVGARADRPAHYVDFRQTGTMWLKAGSPPQHFTARQRMGTSSSGFVWRGKIGALGKIMVVDSFVQGRGFLEARLYGALRVAKIDDTAAINQGEMLRYLVELPLNPDAILFDHALEWAIVDGQTITVAAGTGDARAEITFGLDDSGMIVTGKAASRTYDASGKRYPWRGRFWDYQCVSGRLLPMQAEVGWVIDDVVQIYWRGEMHGWQPVPAKGG